ncbi:tbc1 domain family member 13-like [Anaeramoeba flamelloides]|uniref:Tbc1 domain family member 13-like n=1 Tax=Anaeramoeba flamelloides TaxID=1746091 RepID=A0ABQ8XPR3_9EUKA|nr:tbc1 domain family member 13-like [Anaeramoeba flamelloides]
MSKNLLKKRLNLFKLAVESETDLELIKAISFHGIPEKGNYRPIIWKLLLNYLPPERKDWKSDLRKNREFYWQFKKEVIKPDFLQVFQLMYYSESSYCFEEDEDIEKMKEEMCLNEFKKVKEDRKLMFEVYKDVGRTRTNMNFFRAHENNEGYEQEKEIFQKKKSLHRHSLLKKKKKKKEEEKEKKNRKKKSKSSINNEIRSNGNDEKNKKDTIKQKKKEMNKKNVNEHLDGKEKETQKEKNNLKKKEEKEMEKKEKESDTIEQEIEKETEQEKEQQTEQEQEQEKEEEQEQEKEKEKEKEQEKEQENGEKEKEKVISKEKDQKNKNKIPNRVLNLCELLYLYAKFNPGIGYVQGMNEILAPIYYIFATDESEQKKHVEPDSFFCFNNIMSEISNFFCMGIDNTSEGINASMTKIDLTLKKIDYGLWKYLRKLQILPHYYCFRWVSLLFSQEFTMPDLVRLWDTLLSDPNRFEFVTYISVAMVICVKDQIMDSEYSATLSLLQNYPKLISIDEILLKAVDISTKLRKN